MRIFDPIHGFIPISEDEQKAIQSFPVQRMRYIHQLAMAYMIYPGACHRRFEHSLGVMDLAGKVFDAVTHDDYFPEELKRQFSSEDLHYWKKVLKMAALCHDIGHLPFSHAAEEVLLASSSHEILTKQLILSDEMCSVWQQMSPSLDPEHVAKCAVGPDLYTASSFSCWEKILHQIIAGGAFGVDRIDYLLRDAHHTGLKYGRFDYEQLIAHTRILVEEKGWTVGIESQALSAAESLLIARYFMFRRLYWLPAQILQTLHLQDYLVDFWQEHFSSGFDWKDLSQKQMNLFLLMTDEEVLTDARQAIRTPEHSRHTLAKRLLGEEKFSLVASMREDGDFDEQVAGALERGGEENVRLWCRQSPSSAGEFKLSQNGRPLNLASQHSHLLNHFPPLEEGFLFVLSSN